jgi:hypothetical protein
MLSTPEVHPRFSFPRHVFYLVGDAAMPALLFTFSLGFSYVEIKSSAFQSQRVNKKIIGPGPAICILNKVIVMPD